MTYFLFVKVQNCVIGGNTIMAGKSQQVTNSDGQTLSCTCSADKAPEATCQPISNAGPQKEINGMDNVYLY